MKLLLFHYYPCAGGKFIANCLASGFDVAFSNFESARDILQNRNIKLLNQCLLATVPKKEHHKFWHNYEQGCFKLFGDGIINVLSATEDNTRKINDMSQLGDVWLPVVSHTTQMLENITAYWQQHKIYKVLVRATPEFQTLATNLKSRREPFYYDPLPIFYNVAMEHDFDFFIDNWDPRLPENMSQITALADALQVSIDLNGISEYIAKYQDFHVVDN